MKIIFTKLRYKNFISSGNVFTEIALDKNHLTLILGKNGHGKSTILDALCFSLFGKPFRKVNKAQLINSINGKGAVVEIEFSIIKDNYKIIRGIKPNKFEVYKNETLVNQTNNDDYQNYLESHILRCGYKSFCQIVILGSASYVPFMELPASQRREIIENILDLEIFSTMNVIAKKEFTALESSFASIVGDKRVLENEVAIQEDNRVNRMDKIRKRMDDFVAKIRDVEVYHNEILALRVDVDSNESLIKDLNGKLEILEKKKNKSLTRYAELQFSEKILKKDIEFYSHNDSCEVCKQDIDLNFKNKIIETKTIELHEIFASLEIGADFINKIKVEHIKILDDLDNLWKIDREQAKVSSDLANIDKRISEYRAEVLTLANEMQETGIDHGLNNKKKVLADLNTKFDTLSIEKETILSALLILKDDGLKAKIISQYVEIINEYINKYLSDMEFLCDFTLDENFNEIIRSRYRDEFSYASFSEGEKLRIDIAILFTWREISKRRQSINTNIMIFDEILDESLDADGVDSLLNIIKRLTNSENVFIISHNERNIDKIENSIKFVKKKGFSILENK